MGKRGKKKARRFRGFLLIILCIFIGIPALWAAVSLIGRVSPESLIPDSCILRFKVPNPVRLADRIAGHEPLPEIINKPVLAAARPLVKFLRESPLRKHPLLRFAARGSIEGALLQARPTAAGSGTDGKAGGGPFLAVWDSGLCSPALRFLPLLSGLAAVPNLYYVQAGKLSRFEYRLEETVIFIGRWRNLLVMCNDRKMFESLISGGAVETGPSGGKTFTVAGGKPGFDHGAYDVSFILSPVFLTNFLAEQDRNIASALQNMDVPDPVEAGLSITAAKLEFHLRAQAASPNPALSRFLEQRSHAPGLTGLLPSGTQYSTILSAGTLEELYDAAALISGPELEESLRRTDSSARFILGLSLHELLFSWTGREFAVFGMEGRPHPVYAVQVGDEQKRQDVFNRAFKTVALNENARLNLDGVRIPRIEVPDFLQSLLRRWDFRIPSPYYTVHNGYLFISESAETLLAAIRTIQKNDVLPKTAVWRNLSGTEPDSSAFSLYYSLDRSLPFFLRGNTAASALLGVYRQGLLRMGFDRGAVRLSLSVIPGSGRGLALLPGYPLAVGGNPANHVFRINAGKAEENRVLLVSGGSALALNPADNSIQELSGQGAAWFIPAEGLTVKSVHDAAAWAVSPQGRVNLVNGGMEPAKGFPVLTGLRLSSPPAAWGGRLFLCDEDGKVHAVDSKGTVQTWETSFAAALRSPPAFLTLPKSGKTYAAVYPKSFFGEIWLLDAEGRALPGWPARISGIAFGSPFLFSHNSRVLCAFITQAGELSVFDENAAALPPFPLELDGVFYIQPVFDGECLWLAAADGTLFRISMTGEVLRHNIPGFQVMEEGYITVFDSDGDKTPEVFVSGEGNALHGYSGNFSSLEGFPLPVWGRPLFADLNGDGKAECTGIGMDKLLYRWQFR